MILDTSGTTSLPRGSVCSPTRRCTETGSRSDAFYASAPIRPPSGPPARCSTSRAIGPLVLCVRHRRRRSSPTSYFEPTRALELVTRERATVLHPAYPPITQALLDASGLRAGRPRRRSRRCSTSRPLTPCARCRPCCRTSPRSRSTGSPRPVAPVDVRPARRGPGGPRLNTCGARRCPAWTWSPRRSGRPADRLQPALPARSSSAGSASSTAYHGDPELTAQSRSPPTASSAQAIAACSTQTDGCSSSGASRRCSRSVARTSRRPRSRRTSALTRRSSSVQVFGIPDARLDEVPVAFVELQERRQRHGGRAAGTGAGADLARFKVPSHVRLVTEWPMSATKIQKQPLRRQLVQELEAAATG